MTTELVLLLGLFAFILLGVFLGKRGPDATFRNSAPFFAGRLEQHISTGVGFSQDRGGATAWEPPPNSGRGP